MRASNTMAVFWYWLALLLYAASMEASGQLEYSSNFSEQCNFTSPAFKADVMVQIQELFRKEVLRQRYLGESSKYAATSCEEIQMIRPCILPGAYWVETDGGVAMMNCTEWRKVADVDMKRDTRCPDGLEEYTESVRGKTLCRKPSASAGCFTIVFSAGGIPYSHVRGRVVGYQFFYTDAFWPSLPIDDAYVDGVSITYGHPRNHIWTFAAGFGEQYSMRPNWSCPCAHSTASTYVPSFVGDDFYCDIGNPGGIPGPITYIDNPLWDGKGCGPTSTCCDNPSLPWFNKQLPQQTTENIEVRLCRDDARSNEDVLLEAIELYVK